MIIEESKEEMSSKNIKEFDLSQIEDIFLPESCENSEKSLSLEINSEENLIQKQEIEEQLPCIPIR